MWFSACLEFGDRQVLRRRLTQSRPGQATRDPSLFTATCTSPVSLCSFVLTPGVRSVLNLVDCLIRCLEIKLQHGATTSFPRNSTPTNLATVCTELGRHPDASGRMCLVLAYGHR